LILDGSAPTVVGMAAALAVATAAMPLVVGWRPAAVVVLAVWGLAYGAVPVAMQTWVFTADGLDLWSGSALYPAAFQASIAVGSLLGGGVVGILGDRGAIWTGTVFSTLALLGFGLFARPTPSDVGEAGRPLPLRALIDKDCDDCPRHSHRPQTRGK
jgi:predicted MFS family arabinose efflux permease